MCVVLNVENVELTRVESERGGYQPAKLIVNLGELIIFSRGC